jgi:hypothetical protein
MILPLPSSPHWAPITVTLAMLLSDLEKKRPSAGQTGAYNR